MSKEIMKYTLGAVSFAQECPDGSNSAGFCVLSICGRERQELLRKARDEQPLPGSMLLVGQASGGGWKRITPGEVDWAGLRPTQRL